ncbi:hypothetical protein L208DRAFT_1378317 [Tricholoma matsutake]|nr:hypothetical protein L208DRAFT_1378317 [Tricholoma matsutake 945]
MRNTVPSKDNVPNMPKAKSDVPSEPRQDETTAHQEVSVGITNKVFQMVSPKSSDNGDEALYDNITMDNEITDDEHTKNSELCVATNEDLIELGIGDTQQGVEVAAHWNTSTDAEKMKWTYNTINFKIHCMIHEIDKFMPDAASTTHDLAVHCHLTIPGNLICQYHFYHDPKGLYNDCNGKHGNSTHDRNAIPQCHEPDLQGRALEGVQEVASGLLSLWLSRGGGAIGVLLVQACKQPKICEDVTQWEAIILNLKLAIQWEEQVFKQGGVPKGSSSSGCLTLDSKKAEMEGMDSDVRKDSDNKDADGEMDDSDDSAQKWGDEGGGVVNDKSEPEQDIKMVKRKRQDSNEGAEDRAMKRKRGVSGNTLGDNCMGQGREFEATYAL